MSPYAICVCTDPACRLRYPAADRDGAFRRCPRCGGPITHARLLAPDFEQQSRKAEQTGAEQCQSHGQERVVLQGLLDNVRSVFNVGSIFRSADGAGLELLYLCGVTPANPKLAKTALGAEQVVAWQAAPNAVELAERLIAEGRPLWALEEGPGAESLLSAPAPRPGTVLVVGGEVMGIDPDLLHLCERTFKIPMQGSKRSLNVATAFGIAAVLLANGAEVR
jgi:tRNA G18 (ribose-2'-O)-methylase SpoU